MTIEQAQLIFNLLIPKHYYAVRQEITVYNSNDVLARKKIVMCELYSSALKSDEGTDGAWIQADTWEMLIQLFLEKTQEQKHNENNK